MLVVLPWFRCRQPSVHMPLILSLDIQKSRDSHTKFDLACTVLIRLNEGGCSAALAARREVIRRVVDFEDFTRCSGITTCFKLRGSLARCVASSMCRDSFTPHEPGGARAVPLARQS